MKNKQQISKKWKKPLLALLKFQNKIFTSVKYYLYIKFLFLYIK